MKLLVDIGNSLIHLGVYQENKKIFYEQLSSNINVDKLLSCMEEVLEPFLLKIQRCIVSSVKPQFNSVIELLVEKYCWNYLLVDSVLKTNFKFVLDDVITLGADLIAAAVGAVSVYPNRNIIIIDMGTATTISCIKDNSFIGGAILPGLLTSGEALIEKAALLKKDPWFLPPEMIAKNTKDCLSVGIIYGHAMAIKGIVETYQKQLKDSVVIILGGNYFFVKNILQDYQFINDLIFTGLNILWTLNEGEE